jgi:hypothetical protein
LFKVSRNERQVCPRATQGQGHGLTESFAGPGDDGYFTSQIMFFHLLFPETKIALDPVSTPMVSGELPVSVVSCQ